MRINLITVTLKFINLHLVIKVSFGKVFSFQQRVNSGFNVRKREQIGAYFMIYSYFVIPHIFKSQSNFRKRTLVPPREHTPKFLGLLFSITKKVECEWAICEIKSKRVTFPCSLCTILIFRYQFFQTSYLIVISTFKTSIITST